MPRTVVKAAKVAGFVALMLIFVAMFSAEHLARAGWL